MGTLAAAIVMDYTYRELEDIDFVSADCNADSSTYRTVLEWSLAWGRCCSLIRPTAGDAATRANVVLSHMAPRHSIHADMQPASPDVTTVRQGTNLCGRKERWCH